MDKIDRLLDAIEHPDRYSKKEMEVILADPEIKEVYNLLNKTKASLSSIPVPDVDAEWKAFERSHQVSKGYKKRRFSILNLASRNVAASIAIGIVSFAAVATIVGAGINYVLYKEFETPSTEIISVAEEDIVSNDTTNVVEKRPDILPETIVFDNKPFETIANRIAEYYDYNVEFASDEPKTLRLYFRWNQAQPLDEVVESLNNFEHIRITVKDKIIKID